MKNLTKLLLLSLVLMLSMSVNAQNPYITVLGGLNLSDMFIQHNNATTDIESSYVMKFGFHGGFMYDHILSKNRSQEFAIETGVLFDTKGVDQELAEGQFTIDNAFTLYYVDIHVMLKYLYRFRSLNKIYFGAGPYAGVGLFGKKEYTYAFINNVAQTKIKNVSWGTDEKNDDFKRMDYGVTAKAGFLMHNGLNLSASYDFGIPNIATQSDIRKYKHRLIRVSVAYSFELE